MDPFEIKPASWRDIGEFYRLERLCFEQDAWPLLDVIAVLVLPNVVRLKAMAGAQVAGFVIGDRRPRQTMAWIASIAVHPDQRGRGIGTALLRACEAQLKVPTLRLSVRTSNSTAIRLYKQLGFQATGTWSGYYKGGEDALVMEKSTGVLSTSVEGAA